MSGANLCRLCVNICSDYRNLYDENGGSNKTYEITVKYFDPMFLNVEQGNHQTVMCLICWQHIFDFHNFRQSVLLAQTQLLEGDKVAAAKLKLSEYATRDIICGEISVKEEEFISVPEKDFVECPASEKTNDHETTDISYDFIVKEEVDFHSTQEDEGVRVATEYSPWECNTGHRNSNEIVNNNLFVKDEAELISLVKSTPKITFTKCRRTTETIEENPYNINIQDMKVPLGAIEDYGNTHNLSQYHENPDDSFTGDVDNNDDALIDASGYELESIDEEDSCEIDELLPNYKAKRRRKNEIHNAAEGSHKLKLEATKELLFQYENKTKRTCYKPLNKGKRSELHSSIEAKPKLVATKTPVNISQNNDQTKSSSSKAHSIKRKREEELDEIIAQWKPSLECLICSETFATYTLLQDHFCQQHPNKECYILCCEIKLKRRGHVAEHVRLHIDSNAFKCEFCSKRCTRKRNLRLHMFKKHGISQEDQSNASSSKCPPINNEFDGAISKEDLRAGISGQMHKKNTIITDNGEFSENEDGNASLKNIRKASEKQPQRKLAQQESDDMIAQCFPNLECAACKESCLSFTLLHQHFRQKHPNGDGYVLCCQRKFCRRTKFQEHIRIHLDPATFECEICGKCLETRLNFKHHLAKLHQVSKDQEIDSQGTYDKVSPNSNPDDDSESKTTEFSNKSPKRKTIQELDAIIAKWRPNLECLVCNETSSSFTLLQQHFSQSHPDVRCYITCCQLKFTGRHDIEGHIRYHNNPNAFKCEFCDRCFTSGRNLNRHVRSIHNNA